MRKLLIGIAAAITLSGCNFQLPFDSQQGVDINKKRQDDIEKQTDKGRETLEHTDDETNESQEKTPKLTLEASLFNEIKEVNGILEILNPNNILALVNKEFALPGSYEPDDLVRPKVAFSFGDQDIEKSYLRKEAAEGLEKMFAEAKKEGIHLFAVSGYRSYSRQKTILESEIKNVGEEEALQAVAYPGKSEHQTGLAMDITSQSANLVLSEEFGETEEGKWLENNAHLYGFILRYPKGLESITGYQYEPWHFRYVGQQTAKVIFENNWTLEEFFEEVEKI